MKGRWRRWAMAAALLGCGVPLLAAQTWPFPWPEDRIAGYTARRAASPIVIDGRLDEAAWQRRRTLAAFRRSHRRKPRHPRHARRGAVGRHVSLRWLLDRGAVRRGDADRARRADLQEQRCRAVHRRPRRLLRVRDQRTRHDLRGPVHLGAASSSRAATRAGRSSIARARASGPSTASASRSIRAARASATSTGTCRASRRRSTSTGRSTTTRTAIAAGRVELRIPGGRSSRWRCRTGARCRRATATSGGWISRASTSTRKRRRPRIPAGWAWSPHGVWDSHIPELFTRVRFSTLAAGGK